MIKNIYKLIKSFFVNNKSYFLLGIILIVGLGSLYRLGVSHGRSMAKQEYIALEAQQAMDTLSQFIESTKQLAKAANDASYSLSRQIVERKLYDEQSNQALQDALNKTANDRSYCVFDDSVLRFIDSARANAAQATTHGFTSTTDGTMRITRKTTK
ncbi:MULTISPECIES: hypothetical protein [unclassified Gilliamella]|uniref:hypothetical protein n=1 Tax=unclassified Gilliamella TaxID=2685620 RepID=UPI001308605E|nr:MULTISPECIES: hypothetical protein [unclassified Gilliamella]MWP48831.1 hypothetical protein [Gilliamella sp. Lep-s35]MWP68825.1 hypothetical protein [Gilliamella sp. Lep-s5]MWP77102.1 hypothetical protein [Gilliamella sp. Lep-s21]